MEKISKGVSKTMSGLLVFSGFLIFVSVIIQVLNAVLRKLFGSAILWCDEVTQYATIEACFLATPYLVMHGKELSVGVINSVVKNKTFLMVLRLVFVVLELVIFFWMSKYCLTAAQGLKTSGIMLNTLKIKKYILYYIAEITFLLDFIMLLSAPFMNKGGLYHD